MDIRKIKLWAATSSIIGLMAQSCRLLSVLIFLISWIEVGITGEVSKKVASIGTTVTTEKDIC